MDNSQQAIVVILPARILRKVRLLLDGYEPPYADVNEFVNAAIETQLTLASWTGGESLADLQPVPLPAPRDQAIAVVLSRFSVHPSATEVGTAPDPTPGDALFVLTNRLAPIAFGMRVLVNAVAAGGGPVSLGHFLADAARAAREVGLHVRTEDRAAGRIATERRWIGWPVGENETKALERYKWSFLLSERSGNGTGPLVDLGLADVVDGRVLPTVTGKAVGTQPSPLLGETTGWTLSDEQIASFGAAIRRNRAEAMEVALFARLVAESGGRQTVIDRDLQTEHPGWTTARAVAHRAAMLGRLKDLGAAEVHGSGASAVIKVSADRIRNLIETGDDDAAIA